MSDHKKPMSPELRQALINHGLETDTPSQLADAFRHGWKAAQASAAVQAEREVAVPYIWAAETHEEKQLVDGKPRRVLWQCKDGVGTPLYLHPPQASATVPDDVAKDADRYRWLRSRMVGVEFDLGEQGITALSFEMPDGCAFGGNCDQNIDNAMLAASQQDADKGGE